MSNTSDGGPVRPITPMPASMSRESPSSESSTMIHPISRRGLTLPLAVIATVVALLSVALSPNLAHAATTTNRPCRAGLEQIAGKCLPIIHTTSITPAASAALEKAVSTPAGRAALLKVFRSVKGAKAGISTTPLDGSLRAELSCPGGVQCGVSSSGGWHVWVIASYAAAESADLAGIGLYCTAALSPIITPFGAAIACGGVTYTIWTLVNNWPRLTNHGIWVAVYPTHISSGRY